MKRTVLVGSVGCLAVGACLLGGCSSGPTRPARISHVVLFTLEDASDREALLADCDRLLPGIPGVVSYAAGRHLDVGRETVDSEYDVGLLIGFGSEQDYRRYIDHPRHVELVQAWRGEIETLRVFDVVDETD